LTRSFQRNFWYLLPLILLKKCSSIISFPRISVQTFTNHLTCVYVAASGKDSCWPSNTSYNSWLYHHCGKYICLRTEIFGKIIIFLTYYIEEPLTISLSTSFINMQLLGQSYFVGMEESRFQRSIYRWLTNNFLIRRYSSCTELYNGSTFASRMEQAGLPDWFVDCRVRKSRDSVRSSFYLYKQQIY